MAILTHILAGAFGSALGEIAEEVAKAAGGVGVKQLSAEAMTRIAGYLGAPRNHDVARAIRMAQLNAARALLEAYRKHGGAKRAMALDYLDA